MVSRCVQERTTIKVRLFEPFLFPLACKWVYSVFVVSAGGHFGLSSVVSAVAYGFRIFFHNVFQFGMMNLPLFFKDREEESNTNHFLEWILSKHNFFLGKLSMLGWFRNLHLVWCLDWWQSICSSGEILLGGNSTSDSKRIHDTCGHDSSLASFGN